MKSFYTPNDFKHLATDAEMIQAAVDAAAEAAVSVIIPKFNERTERSLWEIDKTILLHTGSDVQLDSCHIRLADDTFIHFFANDAAMGRYWRKETRQYDINITGRGMVVLDGGKHNGIFEKDFTIYDENGNFVKYANPRGISNISVNRGINFRNVERVSVSGLRFINQRYWAMNFEFCAEGHVSNITFDAPANVPNQDGIDIRVGCHNFLVENIYGKTGDDTIALTNFGVSMRATNGEETDMDIDIHDVIIKNVRGYLTDECDIIRILNRGGAKIYNVQIANVVDITPEGQKGRALAAIRIGDICDYQSRRNELGETKNITVRDVVTHSRFGLYIADTLSDSVFENIQMTNGIGVGAYFNGCTLRNVYIDKFLYSAEAVAREDDIGYEEKFHRVKIDEINAFHFNNCTAENLNIANVVTGKGLKYVFGGNSPITVKATNIVTQDEGTALSTCAVIA